MHSHEQISLKQISPLEENAVAMIEKLNQYQVDLYGREYCTLESPEDLQKNNAFMIGAYIDEILAGIGAIKIVNDYAEIKRMYTHEDHRGKRIAEQIIKALEKYALHNGIHKILLETGNLHHAAMHFYKRCGYSETTAFGNYPENGVSVFFEKELPSSF
ncbi:MAG: GCN5-related N-acetyltransferase [Bacteroidota bacterium]|nr:GCN5-related N-acetyltransferase [Bacteroidota bacterium]